jgi:hypothetical protein
VSLTGLYYRNTSNPIAPLRDFTLSESDKELITDLISEACKTGEKIRTEMNAAPYIDDASKAGSINDLTEDTITLISAHSMTLSMITLAARYFTGDKKNTASTIHKIGALGLHVALLWAKKCAPQPVATTLTGAMAAVVMSTVVTPMDVDTLPASPPTSTTLCIEEQMTAFLASQASIARALSNERKDGLKKMLENWAEYNLGQSLDRSPPAKKMRLSATPSVYDAEIVAPVQDCGTQTDGVFSSSPPPLFPFQFSFLQDDVDDDEDLIPVREDYFDGDFNYEQYLIPVRNDADFNDEQDNIPVREEGGSSHNPSVRRWSTR